jgi:L-ascorbate metabolism protein UlaG (beta-lactamase superfamily)
MSTLGGNTTITWLGHGTFHIVSPGGKRLLIDPWLDTGGNPKCPPGTAQRLEQEGIDAIFITHGHFDHIADLLHLATATDAKIASIYDITGWLVSKGVPEDRCVGFNKGGTVEIAGIRATMTNAIHSSSFSDNGHTVYMGTAAGYVLRMENGFTIYATGDTAVTSDMQIVGELYQPDVVILPIGDHFTMDPRQAAYALKLIRPRFAIPGHYGTFPLLHGTPEALREHLTEFGVVCDVVALRPGESIS